MAHLEAVTTVAVSRASVRAQLYKTDYPRRIDRYIDFFGDGAARAETATDCCGELLLGSLA